MPVADSAGDGNGIGELRGEVFGVAADMVPDYVFDKPLVHNLDCPLIGNK